ncbi:formate dehydrogenase subunit gamma [Sulfitobacter sp. D35]|uniref:formate dehydrogenase subunit gamma n=1 Tax=Sulfitobacter sp. D35 TaxID=3083252 RepID=UPI00296E652F|nr:formate dehydrogenase subunit gamma [Sulfitobacter sp. D35]MDW4497639.1 formate dehydrogenase subunit gamma [Sulfitobacter sp. D35]
MRYLIAVLFLAILPALAATPGAAQDIVTTPVDRSATGGATTLEDIMRRQKGLEVDNSYRAGETGDPGAAAPVDGQLGTLGGASDADLWRGIRFDAAQISTQANGPATNVLVQDGGMWWLELRRGPLAEYGGYLLLGTLALLALFFLIRGRIRIQGEKTGRRIERFSGIERFAHWLLATSFILLAVTGLVSIFGRQFLIPAFGKEAFASLAIGSKWIHNNISWAFMLALVMVFVLWVVHNVPKLIDLKWFAKGGGIVGNGHPPAEKFNAGQKLIFWAVIILGVSVSASGLSLIFPFEFHMFEHSFRTANDWGLTGLVGADPLPVGLTPQEEMQYAQLWHAIIGFVMIAVILAHIYIGSVGMEGAFQAMGSGEVEEAWAREHHSLWYDKVKNRTAEGDGRQVPGE